MRFAERLMADIRARGGIGVADYMARCNAHYYASRDPLGTAGDFITAPEISQMFGELIGAWAMDLWQRAGAPADTMLVELGPGRGTLMTDALRAVPPLAEAAHVHFVEASPALRGAQALRLPHAVWHDALEHVPRGAPALFIANEFFDALPVIQEVLGADGRWRERQIVDDDGLHFAPDGKRIRERAPAAAAIAGDISGRLAEDGGAALITDYGYTEGTQGDTLQAVAKHRQVDVLACPGEADLTAHVDFLALRGALSDDVRVSGPVTQAAFLSALGIGVRAETLMKAASEQQRADIAAAVRRLTAAGEMGSLFKVMALTGGGWPVPAGFSA